MKRDCGEQKRGQLFCAAGRQCPGASCASSHQRFVFARSCDGPGVGSAVQLGVTSSAFVQQLEMVKEEKPTGSYY